MLVSDSWVYQELSHLVIIQLGGSLLLDMWSNLGCTWSYSQKKTNLHYILHTNKIGLTPTYIPKQAHVIIVIHISRQKCANFIRWGKGINSSVIICIIIMFRRFGVLAGGTQPHSPTQDRSWVASKEEMAPTEWVIVEAHQYWI